MKNYNHIITTLKDGKLSRAYSSLQSATFKSNSHLRPTPPNLIRPFLRGHPEHIRKALINRQADLFPGLLKPFSERARVLEQARRVAADLRRLVDGGACIETIWRQWCEFWSLPDLKQPRRDKLTSSYNWSIILRRRVRKASFIYDSIIHSTNQYVSDRLAQHNLNLRSSGRYLVTTETGDSEKTETWTYSKSLKYKQYCRASGYLVRSLGIGDLAINRGLEPYAVTITPQPAYNMHSSGWLGHAPDRVSQMLMKAMRICTDSLRKSGTDVEIIRVTEPQLNGTPHMHLLIFTEQFELVEAALYRAFTNKVMACGSTGIYSTRAHDWRGQLRYMLKSLWGQLRGPNAGYEDQILAWGEHGSHRRFGHVSTLHNYPSVAFFDRTRRELADIELFYKDRLREDVQKDNDKLRQINIELAQAAQAGDYADFCRAYWRATASDYLIRKNQPLDVDRPTFRQSAQLRLHDLGNLIYDRAECRISLNLADFCPVAVTDAGDLTYTDTS